MSFIEKLQDHPRDCDCYYCYLKSEQWQEAKRKAASLLKKGGCSICGAPVEAWHHYRSYEAIWTDKDYLYITPVCNEHHTRCHFRKRDGKKIPLTKRDLSKRYWWVKRIYPIGNFRASVFFGWLGSVLNNLDQ